MNHFPRADIPQLRMQLSLAITNVQTNLFINYGTPAVAQDLRAISMEALTLNKALEHETLPALSAAAAAFADCIERLDEPERPAPCREEKGVFQAHSADTLQEFSDASKRDEQQQKEAE